MRVQPDQGSSIDDTATNDIQFKCSDGTLLTNTGGRTLGDWDLWKECPSGYVIRGLKTQIEVGTGDDTGLNNVIFKCSRI